VAFEALIAQLQAEMYADRHAAAMELARDASGVDLLVGIVREKTRDRGRAAAVSGLVAAAGNFPERLSTFVDLLAETFQEGSDASWEAASALAELDAPRAMREVLSAAARLASAQPDKPVEIQGFVVAHGLELLAPQDEKWQEQAIGPLAMLLRKGLAGHIAAAALSRMDDDRAFSVLLDALKGFDPTENDADLIENLVKSPRSAAHADEVAAALGRIVETDPFDEWGAADHLAQFPEGRARLRRFLRAPIVPESVLEAIGDARDRAAVRPLIDRLAWDQSDEARQLVWVLGEIGDERAAPAVSAQLELPGRSLDAARALASMGRPGVLSLLQHWEDPDAQIRHSVREAVTEQRGQVVPEMLDEIVAGTDLNKARASRALASLDEAQAAPHLRELLRHDSPMVRLAASDAFIVLTSPPPSRALEALLDDAIPEIRASAATALTPEAHSVAETLVALLDDPHPQVREAAATAVAEVSIQVVSQSLRARLTDSDERVCAAAARSLATADPSAVPALCGLLGHSGDVVRNSAAVALAKLGEEGLAAIADAATSGIPVVRAAAATAAGARGDLAGLRMLGSLIGDEDADVRLHALEAVPASGANLIKRISEIMHAGEEQERHAAARALLRIAGTDVGEDAQRTLLEAIDDPSRVVVRSAVAAIDTALASVDPTREPLPRWFQVLGDGYGLEESEQALAVIAALERAATRDPVTARLAAAALETVSRTLEEKLYWGPRELQRAYLVAPSREPDVQLIEHLSEVAQSVPGEPRYLDATLFQDGRRQPDGTALCEGEAYDLEVAVRVSPSGISAAGGREPIAEPRQGQDVEVVVVAEGRAGLTVEEPVAHLILPPAGDSTVNAVFRVNAEVATVNPAALAELRLRLFYRCSLLESAVIQAEIVSRFRPEVRSQLGLKAPITLVHDRIERGYEGLQDDIERSLHIDVSRADSNYLLRFTWQGESSNVISLPAPSFLQPRELGEIIEDARRKLLQVTMSDAYAFNLEPGANEYLEAMRTLATAGRDLYSALFQRKHRSAIAEVGRLLSRIPPPAGSVIQISVARKASDFLFPWALLYDAPIPADPWEEPDPDGFWGMRYCIEQRLPGPQPGPSAKEKARPTPLRMAFMLWEQFVNSSKHRAMIDGLFRDHPGDLEVSSPITRASEANRAMVAKTPSDIYYFFVHAHVRNLTSGTTDAFIEAFRNLPDSRQAREAFKDAYNWAVKSAREPSWIGLSHGRLRLNDLYAGPVEFHNNPLIFVNACESSQLTPSLSGESFVDFFLDRGATAFLGTECTMTAIFAHAFGEFVLRRLLSGETIGAALLAARRYFIMKRNPLGLAYNQYGYAGFLLNSTRLDTSTNKSQ
jgi:HEAT repeat protein